jgi:signal transduction histidine kinase
VTPREGELAVGDRELLAALADQAAPALAALALTDDLRRSRQALVTAREEERRRLRSDLHDGLGAALAGVRLQLDAAADLVEDARARRVLDAATAGVVEAVADVRRLTDDLRPPALDELGLPGSLVALGERLRTPSLSVKVDVAPLQPLPAATEVAAYRIAAEALANAARHSGARNVLLQAAAAGGRVTLTVQDDGGGVSSASGTGGSGLGLPSMRQRAEEIGGELSLSSSSAGTTVRAVLPT